VSQYVFDNARPEAGQRFASLEGIFDPGTFRHLGAIGVAEGWRCLEVGGGGGSVAAWLGDRVGPKGAVLVTDIDTRYLETLSLPNVTVQRHDITCDDLPSSAFDLVHTRLVLCHLPQRETALDAMIQALKPGGWLVVEDFDYLSLPPDFLGTGAAFTKARQAQWRLFVDRGAASLPAGTLHRWLRERGLVDVESEGRVFVWQGGSLGSRLHRANFEQISAEMLARGLISELELVECFNLLNDPTFAYLSPLMMASWGRRLS
jgi:SAM-dependent methyltransferase